MKGSWYLASSFEGERIQINTMLALMVTLLLQSCLTLGCLDFSLADRTA